MAKNTGSNNGRKTFNEQIKDELTLCKKGAKCADGNPVSDFARGVHKQKAESLIAKKTNGIKKIKTGYPKKSTKIILLAKGNRRAKQKAYRESRKNNK